MIDVLLATYQPDSALLKAQVDSIRAQVGVKVNLVCREDAEGLGARGNFDRLLRESKADYLAFSDQDDVWCSEKLSRCLAKLQELEALHGKATPLLVFCDGWVTDAALNRLSGTVLSRQRVNVAEGLAFNRLLMQNFIAGMRCYSMRHCVIRWGVFPQKRSCTTAGLRWLPRHLDISDLSMSRSITIVSTMEMFWGLRMRERGILSCAPRRVWGIPRTDCDQCASGKGICQSVRIGCTSGGAGTLGTAAERMAEAAQADFAVRALEARYRTQSRVVALRIGGNMVRQVKLG